MDLDCSVSAYSFADRSLINLLVLVHSESIPGGCH